MFVGLLISIDNASNQTKSISLSNQKCMIQPTLINLHPNENREGFRNYPFAVKLDRCVGSCSILLITYLRQYVLQARQKF